MHVDSYELVLEAVINGWLLSLLQSLKLLL
jgi:hypothetical protein